jgi:serine/threonine-protein kinase
MATREEKDGEQRTLPSGAAAYGGRYSVEEELGRGGMGRVVRARDLKLDRAVALKLLAPGVHSEEQRQRFEQEARAAGALNHPNILAVHDIGEQGGEPFIVTELLEGETLRSVLSRGPLAPARALEFAVQLAEGLAAAHAAGIIHRDVKPENLFLTKQGHLKILDFGIAKLLEGKRAAGALHTDTGAVMGTPGYMSPEQVNGEHATARTDVFAFGAVLHEMLAGRGPFERPSGVDAAHAILHDPPAPLPPSPLSRIVARCLEKDPAARPADAGEVLAELRQISSPAPRRRRGFFAAAGLALAAAVAIFILRPHAVSETVQPSIAVLPFVNLSSDKEQEYFSDGIAEEILNALAQVEGLNVAGRTSSFYFKGKNEDLASIAARLHVSTLLEGSVRKAGGRVRITAQLINAADGYHLWSKQYDRELTDIFKVQSELATAVVEALKVKLLPGTSLSSKVHPARDPEAYRLFLLGRSLVSLGTKESTHRAAATLEKAVELEPSYAPAWEWLAYQRGNTLLALSSQAHVSPRQVLEAAERAVAADPEYSGGWAARGWVRANFLWDWAAAQSDLERALALSSRSGMALNAYAVFLQKQGRLKEAIATQRKFHDTDPLGAVGWINLGGYLISDGQFDAAREALRRALEVSPDNPRALQDLASIDLLDGRPARALQAFEKVPLGNDRLMSVAIAQHELGHARESQQALAALAAKPEGDVAYRIAAVHAWRGERDAAFEWLERAYARHDLQLRFLKVDPFLRNLRGDPRYSALLKKINLPAD